MALKILKKRGNRKAIVALVATVATLGALASVKALLPEPAGKGPNSYEVRRGGFRVSIDQTGNLEPIKKHRLVNEYRYSTKVISVIPEGTIVKEGDLVIQLDGQEIEDRLRKEEIDVEEAQNTFVQARENLELQRSIVQSQVKAAELKVEFALLDLEQYEQGTWPQQKRDLERMIVTAKEALLLAEDDLEWAIKLHAEGFETKSKLDNANLQVTKTRTAYEKATEALRIAKEYEYPKRLRQLQANASEARANLARTGDQGMGKIAKAESSLRSAEYRLKTQTRQLEDYRQQLAATRLTAPRDGMVIFPMNPNSRSSGVIEEGTSVYNQQVLAEIPDTSQLKINIMVHESDIPRLRIGRPAVVTFDSFPGERYLGKVIKVAHVPDSRTQYYNPGLKVYETQVLLDSFPPDAKPGMNGNVSISVADYSDVIAVPAKAVTTLNGQRVVYRKSGSKWEATPVEIGMYSGERLHVVSGLNAGDVISLEPPIGVGGPTEVEPFMAPVETDLTLLGDGSEHSENL